METDSLNPLLEKYKKTIIKETIKKIYEKYFIYNKDEKSISENELIDYLNKLNNPIKKRCCGVSNFPVKQCSKFAVDTFDYCKSHMITYGTLKAVSKRYEDKIEIIEEKKCNQKVDLSKLKKKFIGDSFYYIDNMFIYDNYNEKVGYIDNNEYFLTDDPFILNNNT